MLYLFLFFFLPHFLDKSWRVERWGEWRYGMIDLKQSSKEQDIWTVSVVRQVDHIGSFIERKRCLKAENTVTERHQELCVVYGSESAL